MQNTIRERINKIKQNNYVPEFAGTQATYRFDVNDAGRWRVVVDNGRVDIQESSEPAECVIECNEDDLLQILDGQQNLLTAMLQGRVNITGNIAMAQKFHGMVR